MTTPELIINLVITCVVTAVITFLFCNDFAKVKIQSYKEDIRILDERIGMFKSLYEKECKWEPLYKKEHKRYKKLKEKFNNYKVSKRNSFGPQSENDDYEETVEEIQDNINHIDDLLGGLRVENSLVSVDYKMTVLKILEKQNESIKYLLKSCKQHN